MATNTTNSFTNHTGNNTAGPFSISFDYLAESEVVVTVGGVTKTQTTHYTFPSATTISFTSGNHPANSAVIKFQRNTSVSSKKVDFQDGSVLTEADLDSNTNQLLYGFQEFLDEGQITEADLLDEDNMASNSATKAATQQSIKAYVDANAGTTNLSYTAGTREIASSTGTNVNLPEATTSNAGLQSSSDKTKLDAIEASATADQTAAEIRTLVESATDSNVFTDADHTKLNAIEASATADQTDAEIRTAVEAASDSNVFTDADHTKLNGIAASANNYSISSDLLDEDNMASNSATKAASQQSIKAYVDANSGGSGSTNLSATANGTSLTVESSSGNNVSLPAATTSAWGVMSDDDKTKLDGIASNANVGLTDLVGDTTPQLGGNLDVQAREITTSTTNGNIVLNPNGEFGVVRIKGDSTNTVDGTLELRCSSDSHGVKIKSPAHSAGASYTLTLPSSIVNGAFLKTDSNGGLSFATPTDTNTQLSNAEVRTAVEAASDSNVFTDADHTKLNAIAASANNYVHPNHSGEVTSTADGVTVIADNAVTAAKIAANTIGSTELANGAVGQAAIADGSVIIGKIAVGGVQTNNIGTDAVSTSKIADNAVTLAKMAGLARGKIIYGDSSGDPAALAPGSANQVLTSDGTDISWAAASGGGASTGEQFVKLKNSSGSLNDSGYNTYAGYRSGNALASGGDENTFYGGDAGKSVTTGDQNVFIGSLAGQATTTSSYNTVVGADALRSNETGTNNTALGFQTLNVNTNSQNTAVGSQCLKSNTTGGSNTGVGRGAFESLTTGGSNTALGFEAGRLLTTGSNITVIGSAAEPSSATVSNEITLGNTSITKFRIPGLNFSIKDSTATDNYVLTVDANGDAGWEAAAGGGASTGQQFVKLNISGALSDSGTNTFAGYNSGNAIANGAAENTFYGYGAGNAVTTGDANCFIGSTAGYLNQTGQQNTAIGADAGRFNVSSHNNTSVGFNALRLNTAANNTAVGHNALAANVAAQNTAVGTNALTASTNNIGCVAVGYNASKSSTDAGELSPLRGHITAVGWEALQATTTGGGIVAVGSYAGHSNTTATSNVYVGYSAGRICTTGGSNTALGYYALYSNTAASCTGVGANALSQSTGTMNTALGAASGPGAITGTNLTLLGYGAAPSSTSVSNEVTLGNSSVATLRCQVTSITALSDRRDKTDINTLDLGLDFINSLKPVKFKWDSREGIGKDGTYEAGFIAQDFQQVQKDNDADYLGLVLESNPDKLEATPGKLIPILVKAIQELKMEVETLKNNG
tara:strand:- start:3951 stop:7796 length:3846 start_codon:yes stop_codon:yes gene_type:complete